MKEDAIRKELSLLFGNERIKDQEGLCLYFQNKLFKNDPSVFRRRSFTDLFKYFRFKGVSEKTLLKCLYLEGFGCYKCSDIERLVFFKYLYRNDRFFIRNNDMYHELVNDKYTRTYLSVLFDSIKF